MQLFAGLQARGQLTPFHFASVSSPHDTASSGQLGSVGKEAVGRELNGTNMEIARRG